MPTSALEQTKSRLLSERFSLLRAGKPEAGVYIFLSFDLGNSTHLKSVAPRTWPIIVTRFYEIIQSQVLTRLASVLVWKYIGDEVLFYQHVRRRSDLAKALPAAYDAIAATTSVLHQNFHENRDILSVKGTVWVASAQSVQPGSKESVLSPNVDRLPNIVVPTGRTPAEVVPDFLGPDIDTGFRISRFAMRRRLVVSAAYAWLLYHWKETRQLAEKRLRVVDLQCLKGVWGGRHYPIIWFEPNWKRVRETFLYDEHLAADVVRRIRGRTDAESGIELIEQIYRDLGRVAEIERVDKLITRTPIPSVAKARPQIEISAEKFSEVHCVAICFGSDGRVLTAKRPSTKRRFPGHYEFGCGQLRLGETFGQCLRRAYKDDFGVDLQVPDDPIPVSTFQIHDIDENRLIPGITFIAQINDVAGVDATFSREKHSAIRWVDPADFQEDPGAKYVPDFRKTLLIAHSRVIAGRADS